MHNSKISLIRQYKVFDGWLKTYEHYSASNHCIMIFSIFIPLQAQKNNKVPVLYWLSGLTSTVENFATKSGAFEYANKYGFVIVILDTSPKGVDVVDDKETDAFKKLGSGASYYINATQKPWSDNYHMYDYISLEIPKVIENNFPVNNIKSIFGHSMGGYGALMIGLKNSNSYQSISAFSPIVNPTNKAFVNYLGNNKEDWKQYDSLVCLDIAQRKIPILIDLGSADQFYPEYIQPEEFVNKAIKLGFEITFRLLAGYDHSYFFITSFIQDHFKFHAKYLR